MPALRTNDGQLFELSERAVRLSVTLKNTLNDTPGDAPVLVDLGAARLALVAALLERTVTVVESVPWEYRRAIIERGLPRGAALDDKLYAAAEAALAALGVVSLLDTVLLLGEMRLLDAPLPTTMLEERFARLLRGQSAAALRELLGVADGDHLSADEMSAVLAEPLCAPAAAAAAPAAAPAVPAAPPPTRSVSLAMGESGQDFVTIAKPCLERCDARTLRELKAVSAPWQRRAREVLCDAASAWRRKPIWSPSAEGRALAARLNSAEEYVESAKERQSVLARMAEELDCGVDLPGHARAVVRLLKDSVPGSNWKVRRQAVETLGKLEPAALAQHGAALATRLEDSHQWVRQKAVETLGKLEAAALAQHQQAIAKVAKEDSIVYVQMEARVVMHKLEPAAGHGAALVARLVDSDWHVRLAAAAQLGNLEAAALAQHQQSIAKAAEEDSEARVQIAARVVMHKLEPAAGHMDAIVAKLEDSAWLVRRAAVRTLGELQPPALAQHGAALVARLKDLDEGVRYWAVKTLGKLDLVTLALYDRAIAKVAMEDKDSDVRKAAVDTLGKLDVAALDLHEEAIAKVAMEDKNSNVRRAADRVLSKLWMGQ